MRTLGCCLRALDDGPHDLVAGRVAQGVDDAGVAVAPFAAERDAAGLLVEVRAPLDQLLDPLGGLADDHLDDLGVAERAAGDERVGMWSSKRSSGSSTPAMPPWA